ncbi:MAG: DUF167 domain-containing protein [Hyphomicrobiales bacterium]|nr:DUF167 domain-containing protein [Hyphomicrobiales bacterium]
MPVWFTDRTRTPFVRTDHGVCVRVRVVPRASRQGIVGIVSDGEGGSVLKVSLTAPPVDGKANAALIKFLAREWSLPQSALTVSKGAAGRVKTMAVAGEPQVLFARLMAWIEEYGRKRAG